MSRINTGEISCAFQPRETLLSLCPGPCGISAGMEKEQNIGRSVSNIWQKGSDMNTECAKASIPALGFMFDPGHPSLTVLEMWPPRPPVTTVSPSLPIKVLSFSVTLTGCKEGPKLPWGSENVLPLSQPSIPGPGKEVQPQPLGKLCGRPSTPLYT